MKYLDTDVFVYWAADDPQHGARATEILRHVELNEKAVTSALTFWVFNNLMRAHPAYSLTAFLDRIDRLRNLKVVPLDAETLSEGDETARKHDVGLAVGVAAAVAKQKGADAVYSLNPEFDKTGLRRTF